MMTCQNYIDDTKSGQKAPMVYNIHILDLLAHCFKMDANNTIYGHNGPKEHYVSEMQDAMKKTIKSNFNVYQDNFKPKKRFEEVLSQDGDLSIDAWLDGEQDIFTDERPCYKKQPALNLLLDANIAYAERNNPDMVQRHEKVYAEAARSLSTNRPCKVTSIMYHTIPETDEPILLNIIIKDYNDPLFPGIWAALQSNKTSNSFNNIVMDYFIGTHDGGNGRPTDYHYTNDYRDLEVQTIDAKRIHAKTN